MNTTKQSRPQPQPADVSTHGKDLSFKGALIFAAKALVPLILFALTVSDLPAQTAPAGVVSDWTHHHVLYPDSRDPGALARSQSDPRWRQSWYLRHQEAWWPQYRRHGRKPKHRDWSVALSATPLTAAFEPEFDFTYTIGPNSGYGLVSTTDNGSGVYLGTSGTLTVTAGTGDLGAYPLYPGGPAQSDSPAGKFLYDNLLYPSVQPAINNNGPLFMANGSEINIWSDAPDTYEFDNWNGVAYVNDATGDPFILNTAPGGGQTYPAKFSVDVTAAPSCANDFVVIGVPAAPASGGQANIVGFNNLYSYQGTTGPPPALCPTNGPTVMFAYASGTGSVPASLVLSQNGSQVAYIENLTTGSSYFHVLTIGTTGTNGTGATAAVVPGSAGGNNALDERVLLSPDGGITNQASTTAPFVVYTSNDADDFAYATTFSPEGIGYLYKIGNVFKGSATPTIIWSVAIDAVPSTPVYDFSSNTVFFTDSNGRIDYVIDSGTSPTVVYGSVLALGTTSENPVILDEINAMIYASFNSNGSNAVVVQAPTSLASAVSVPVGAATNIFTGPYQPFFNNAWFTGSGTPIMYVAGTGSGNTPTLYGVGFSAGTMNSSASTSAALATGMADASPITTFYNAQLQKEYLFVGVTDNCIATTEGGTEGCVMSLDITTGFPTVAAGSTALPAPGGTTGIIVDNDSSATEASSIYYATKTGVSLVKATQSGLN
jgi:hypothetical protein